MVDWIAVPPTLALLCAVDTQSRPSHRLDDLTWRVSAVATCISSRDYVMLAFYLVAVPRERHVTKPSHRVALQRYIAIRQ